MTAPLAVITGAAGGIGCATATRLAQDGWRLHLIDIDAAELKALARELPNGTTWSDSSLDTPNACTAAMPMGNEPIHACVHLAGVFIPDDLNPNKRDIYEDAIQHNATNAYDLATIITPRMADHARMVFTSSLSFNRGVADHPAYTMSKGAVVGLTRALSRRLGKRGICVNAVAPGIIDTVMSANIRNERGIENVEREIPLGRIGQPEDIAGVIAFLLSKDAAFITGQVINVDGGVVNG